MNYIHSLKVKSVYEEKKEFSSILFKRQIATKKFYNFHVCLILFFVLCFFHLKIHKKYSLLEIVQETKESMMVAK